MSASAASWTATVARSAHAALGVAARRPDPGRRRPGWPGPTAARRCASGLCSRFCRASSSFTDPPVHPSGVPVPPTRRASAAWRSARPSAPPRASNSSSSLTSVATTCALPSRRGGTDLPGRSAGGDLGIRRQEFAAVHPTTGGSRRLSGGLCVDPFGLERPDDRLRSEAGNRAAHTAGDRHQLGWDVVGQDDEDRRRGGSIVFSSAGAAFSARWKSTRTRTLRRPSVGVRDAMRVISWA